jgi:hypothetical protein
VNISLAFNREELKDRGLDSLQDHLYQIFFCAAKEKYENKL